MTHLCYTLEETANRLNLSETVLVRLSQYFKVPKAAYEEVGYLSFKGDLVFSDQDVIFFRQVKERLLAGENLDEVKSRMRQDPLASGGTAPDTSAGNPDSFPMHLAHVSQSVPWEAEAPIRETMPSTEPAELPATVDLPTNRNATPKKRPPLPPVPEQPAFPPEVEGLREVENRQSFQKAAERSFERYKTQHRTGLSKVFEKMLKDVGASAAKQTAKQKGSLANFRPLRLRMDTRTESLSAKALVKPFVRGADATAFSAGPFAAAVDWEQLRIDAQQAPRALNPHLQTAAQRLREKALAQSHSVQR